MLGEVGERAGVLAVVDVGGRTPTLFANRQRELRRVAVADLDVDARLLFEALDQRADQRFAATGVDDQVARVFGRFDGGRSRDQPAVGGRAGREDLAAQDVDAVGADAEFGVAVGLAAGDYLELDAVALDDGTDQPARVRHAGGEDAARGRQDFTVGAKPELDVAIGLQPRPDLHLELGCAGWGQSGEQASDQGDERDQADQVSRGG